MSENDKFLLIPSNIHLVQLSKLYGYGSLVKLDGWCSSRDSIEINIKESIVTQQQQLYLTHKILQLLHNFKCEKLSLS